MQTKAHAPNAVATLAHKAGMGIIIAVALCGGAALGGWIPELSRHVGGGAWMIIALVAGAIGGTLFTTGKGPLYVGALCGPLAAMGSLAVVSALLHASTSVHHMTMVLALFVGLVPGGALHWLLLHDRQS